TTPLPYPTLFRSPPGQQKDDHAHHRDRGVLTCKISLSAFANGAGDFLHTRIALVGGKHRLRRPYGIKNRKQAAGDDHIKNWHCRLSLEFGSQNPSFEPV